MCGVGGKADRRPIDPPPIVELRVIDPSRKRRPSASGSGVASPTDSKDAMTYAQSFLQNPYYFMFASLAKPEDDAELHWLKDGRTRCTTGSVVSSLYHLKDPQNNNEDAGFFVFPDLSVRTEGSYRLKLSLFEVVGNTVRHCKSIYSTPFYVYTAKKFPGMEESTPLSCSLADQGIKIRIRKDIRVRKRPIQALEPLQPIDGPSGEHDDDDRDADQDGKQPLLKRSRTDNHNAESSREAENAEISTPQPSQQWPPSTTIDSNIGPVIPPPPNAQTQSIPPPSSNDNSASNTAIPHNAPASYDARTGAYPPYDQQTQSHQPHQPQAQAQTQLSAAAHAHIQYRTEPSQLHHQSSQQVAPPPSQQTYVTSHPPPPPTQHMPPPSHMPPPGTHVPHHAPIQQPYAYPTQAWPAPPPQPQPMYDPYGHYHHQHPPPHYPAMPPPAPPAMHMQHAPPHPARYDYAATMYSPYAYPGYYDQPPPPPPPHTHQAQHPQQYAPVPTASSSSSSSNAPQAVAPPPVTAPPVPHPTTMPPPPAPPTAGYADYSTTPYARATSSPQPRPYHQHPHPHPQPHYGPYAPQLAPHPQHQPRHYAPLPPPHPYSYAYGPPPDQWGAPAYPPHASMAWPDAYGMSHSQPQAQPTVAAPTLAQPPAPSTATAPIAGPSSTSMPGSSSSGLVGAVGNPNDRIQLAPLLPRVSTGGTGGGGAGAGTAAVVTEPSSLLAHAHRMHDARSSTIPSASGGTSGNAYPVMHLQNNTRSAYDAAREGRDDQGERDHERLGRRTGKKNLLSIGSIISNE
ncbi:hypothetical protein M378DRAFT_24595 [Amanita muscaria Koide BX008]|uniref:Velvet domain-containing protein n=1 Tax=Amanita muscaria (strain Koide BX008) TaxID=946122 RepID=A0A0C2TBY9_AMAMK|nr:hypothetical protein M378DRAFT_24595 [Amanita muscaria Koide BX008]